MLAFFNDGSKESSGCPSSASPKLVSKEIDGKKGQSYDDKDKSLLALEEEEGKASVRNLLADCALQVLTSHRERVFSAIITLGAEVYTAFGGTPIYSTVKLSFKPSSSIS